MLHGLAVSLPSPPITGLAKKSSEPYVWILNTSLTNFYRQVQSVLLWDTRNGKPQIGQDVALQSRDESKVCDDEEHEKEGLPKGAFGDRREASKCCCAGCLGHSVSIYPKNRVVPHTGLNASV